MRKGILVATQQLTTSRGLSAGSREHQNIMDPADKPRGVETLVASRQLGFLLYLVFHFTSLYADIAITPFLGVSAAILHPSNLYLPGEVDSLHPDKSQDVNALWGGKIGYIKHDWQWGVAYYNQSMHQKGDVWLYQLPDLNAFRYRLTVDSQALMTFAEYQWELNKVPFTPFVYASIGGTTLKATYSETPKISDTSDEIFLNESGNMRLAYALGLGTKLNINQTSYLSIQYQYMDTGNLSFNETLNVSMHQHLLLLGYTFLM